jgi:hypothetical protein
MGLINSKEYMDVDSTESHHIHTTSEVFDKIDSVSNLSRPSRYLTDYFQVSSKLKKGETPNACKPFRTFSVTTTAFHLTHDANIHGATVDETAKLYGLDDLQPALADYLQQYHQQPAHIHQVAGWHIATANCQLPFEHLHVWHQLQMQSKSYHNEQLILPAQTVNAIPSKDDWEFGRFATVLVNTDSEKIWLRSGLDSEYMM